MDYSKCIGHNCPIKDKCYRYTGPSALVWQSYHNYEYVERKGCDDFIDNKDRENGKQET